MLRGKKRKKEQICKLKKIDKEDLYALKINCKGKRTVGKADKGINVEKIIIDFKKLKIKILKRERKKKEENSIEL